MFGTPATAPGMGLVVFALVLLGVVLLVGVVRARRGAEGVERTVRRVLLVLAVLVPLGWHLVYPSGSGIEGAARLLLLPPLVLLDLALGGLWAYRARAVAGRSPEGGGSS